MSLQWSKSEQIHPRTDTNIENIGEMTKDHVENTVLSIDKTSELCRLTF